MQKVQCHYLIYEQLHMLLSTQLHSLFHTLFTASFHLSLTVLVHYRSTMIIQASQVILLLSRKIILLITLLVIQSVTDYLARANLTQGYYLLWLRDSLSLLLCYDHAFIAPLQPFRRFRSPLLTASSLFLLSELVRCFNSLEFCNIHILHIKLYIVILQSAPCNILFSQLILFAQQRYFHDCLDLHYVLIYTYFVPTCQIHSYQLKLTYTTRHLSISFVQIL